MDKFEIGPLNGARIHRAEWKDYGLHLHTDNGHFFVTTEHDSVIILNLGD